MWGEIIKRNKTKIRSSLSDMLSNKYKRMYIYPDGHIHIPGLHTPETRRDQECCFVALCTAIQTVNQAWDSMCLQMLK